jgi:hypothetical protein
MVVHQVDVAPRWHFYVVGVVSCLWLVICIIIGAVGISFSLFFFFFFFFYFFPICFFGFFVFLHSICSHWSTRFFGFCVCFFICLWEGPPMTEIYEEWGYRCTLSTEDEICHDIPGATVGAVFSFSFFFFFVFLATSHLFFFFLRI